MPGLVFRLTQKPVVQLQRTSYFHTPRCESPKFGRDPAGGGAPRIQVTFSSFLYVLKTPELCLVVVSRFEVQVEYRGLE